MIKESYLGLEAFSVPFKSHDKGDYPPFTPGRPWNKTEDPLKEQKQLGVQSARAHCVLQGSAKGQCPLNGSTKHS